MSIINSAKRMARRTIRRVYPNKVPHPDWRSLLGSQFSTWPDVGARSAAVKQRVLLATSIGGHVGVTTIDSMLALALTLRGVSVDVLLCDEVLPACEQCMIVRFADEAEFVKRGPQRDICRVCFPQAYQMFRSLGISVYRYSQFLTVDDHQTSNDIANSIPTNEIKDYSYQGIPVGEHASAGALRFYARGTLNQDVYGQQVLQRYFRAALLTVAAARKIFKQSDYVCASFHHGIYVPQGVIGSVARQEGVRVVNWMPAYRKKSFIFSHDDTYHHTLMSEPVAKWEEMEWTPESQADLLSYLKSRTTGSGDWISFNRNPKEDLKLIQTELGIDPNKPTIGLLTNVIWDAQLHYPANVFPTMIDWLVETIRYFAERPDLQLIIRIHPAEITGHIKSRQPAHSEIERAFPTLPGNVFIIPPESPISTYIVMRQANAVLIYGTKTGVELTSLGIPVIVAGEAWIRNKGITMDPTSKAGYFKMLDQLPLNSRLSDEVQDRARRYAYHFFFRRMIPLQFTVPAEGIPPYRLQIGGPEDLLPGRDLGLDIICDGIIKGTDFIYPAERLGALAAAPQVRESVGAGTS